MWSVNRVNEKTEEPAKNRQTNKEIRMKKTITKRKLCKQPVPIQRTFDPNVSAHRMSFILASNLKWVNGTKIMYMFIEGAEPQKKVVRKAFQSWKNLGIGISFKEVSALDDSMVRIG